MAFVILKKIIKANVKMSIFSSLITLVRYLFFRFTACIFQTQVVARNKTL